ncbi:MAG: beta-N-acetylglucosaminidase domain-containing protein [Planctomycetota bacterium]
MTGREDLRWGWTVLAALAVLATAAGAQSPPIALAGADFAGGAAEVYGACFFGQARVNYVYAGSNGPRSTMTAAFVLDEVPTGPLVLHLTARDDDSPAPCRIEIVLNETVLFSGPSDFPDRTWALRRYPLPAEALRAGENRLVVRNLAAEGELGMPPWFMVAFAHVAPPDFAPPCLQPLDQLTVALPTEVRPFPESLADATAAPGFAVRGIKGWAWTPEQYLEEIPVLARLRMNFLMNCYLSMYSDLPRLRNEWWQPLSEERKAAFRAVIGACAEHGITFCFAIHPQLHSPRPLDPTRDEDFEALWPHYAWAQSEGVRWFDLSLDDVGWGNAGPAAGAAAHARLVNRLLARLREKDPGATFTFVPVPYWGDGTPPDHRAYLETLRQEMDPAVWVFWTGDGVVTPRITRRAAESYREIVGHRLFLWDNYPVNDAHPTMHLGPVIGRDSDLCAVVDGYLSNPHCAQNRINRLPLSTCADYAYNPRAYDPLRSIGQAIAHLAETPSQRRALADLVERYPGSLIHGGGTAANPVRDELEHLLAEPDGRTAAAGYLAGLRDLAARFAREFPADYPAAQRTLKDDIAWGEERASGEDRPRPVPPAPAPLFPADGVPPGWSVRTWNDVAVAAPPGVAWTVVDGTLSSPGERGTWLISDREYGDFLLELEIKLTERGNSGIALRAPLAGDPAFDGIELQVADVRYNPDATAAEITGGLYRALAPAVQAYRPEEWNAFRIEFRGSRLVVDLNGVRIHDVDLNGCTEAVLRHDGTPAPPLRNRPRRGRLGFQHLSRGEDASVLMRNACITELE